jgi:hypothetical protein
VKRLLVSVDGEGEVDRIIEAVPSLTQPRELQQALTSLKTWFPSQVGASWEGGMKGDDLLV